MSQISRRAVAGLVEHSLEARPGLNKDPMLFDGRDCGRNWLTSEGPWLAGSRCASAYEFATGLASNRMTVLVVA